MPAEETMTRPHFSVSLIAGLIGFIVIVLIGAACGNDDNVGDTSSPTDMGETPGDAPASSQYVTTGGNELPADPSGITLLTHDSFALSDETLATFTAQTGIEVTLLQAGDTGTMVSEAILTAGNPLGDVMFGVDNTFLARTLNAELFEPYESPNLADVPDIFKLDPQNRVTPIDFGDVCINYWTDALPADPPTTLEDLTAPEFADQLVVQNPETSSPGLAFLLATIAGTDDWEQFWADLADNGVAVTAGWEDAYYGEFISGGGDRSMVVSYASSPPAEVIYASSPIDTPPTGVLLDSCFRQIEFAGVLSGTDHPAEAQALIDFMLTPTFQDDVPLNMFVFPVANTATLPQVFGEHAQIADDPLFVDPADIEAHRDEWTDRWVEIVLG
ncbi:MAG: thiamine ABC transporter substrate-binding protein [Acidimicrobiaceae bacterium]|nr:thiamine ABC transporter substrate-binding protein [Acidimicrobiaceae bacterium]MYG54767.1 thiamine ABC transporter substrate-binding protein [Acidimicrobiaceae bacterium]MYJ98840.1 thiamine ABC transporter substrate-binding protein [Acidimicrobiaceae bacterium]